MKFSVSLLKKILLEAKFIGFSGDEQFTFLNIAKPTGSLLEKIDESKVLFFPVYAKDVAVDGWYDNPLDRRDYLKEICDKNPEWAFVVDSSCPSIKGKKIIVDDIFKAIIKIYNYVLKKVNPRVVEVTGSVGKTTTVAMLEDAISTRYACLRIYSKRITPLILWSSIINFLNETIQFVVLEMSFYRRHHIEWMAKNLPPDISVILNIAENHIGVAGVDTKQIVEAKSRIITKKSIPVINADDKNLKGIISKCESPFLFSAKNGMHYIYGRITENAIIEIHAQNSPYRITPFLATNLTMYQAMAVFAVCSLLGMDLNLVAEAINNFHPKENRISRKNIKGREVIFDGDVTHPSRLIQLADSAYKKSVLIVHEFDFGIDPFEPKLKGMMEVFKRFNAIRISNKTSIPNMLKEAMAKEKIPHVSFVNPENLVDNLPSDAMIFYHYGTYFRRNNLEQL